MIQLYENETITKTIRRHWFIVAVDILIFFYIALIPLIIAPFLNNIKRDGYATDYLAFIVFFYLVWLEFSWILFAVAWTTNYYLDVVLITNRRLLKIEQKGLFARDIAEMRLERIQDIRVDVTGVIPSLLDFGTLKVQTAGEEEQFIIVDVPNPNSIKNIIFEHHDDPQGPITKQGL
ncbi:MAG: PH domain-containing protein [Patescibacteria group bacterium]